MGLAQASGSETGANGLQQSIQSLQQALDINPLDPSTLNTCGTVYLQAGLQSPDPAARTNQISKAIPFFQQAAQLAPNYPEAYCGLGRCSFLLGDPQKAQGLYQKALRMNPHNGRTYMYLGELHYRLKNLERAYQDFAAAAALDMKNIEARKNVGLVLTLLGRKDEAIREYLEALNRAPGDLVILRRLASLYFARGDDSNGTAFARRAYDATPPAQKGSFDTFVTDLHQK